MTLATKPVFCLFLTLQSSQGVSFPKFAPRWSPNPAISLYYLPVKE